MKRPLGAHVHSTRAAGGCKRNDRQGCRGDTADARDPVLLHRVRTASSTGQKNAAAREEPPRESQFIVPGVPGYVPLWTSRAFSVPEAAPSKYRWSSLTLTVMVSLPL